MTITASTRPGTVHAYSNLGCRCDDCRQAVSEYRRGLNAGTGTPTRLAEPRPFWFSFASCRPEYADRPIDQWVDQFFPGRGEATRHIKDICAECPAQEACAEHGLAEKHGIWGGMSERERRRLRRKLAAITPPIPSA